MKKYALISVFDKTGIVDLARQIEKLGYTIISTGGTAKILEENNIHVTPIQDITGNPESFDGRMKTISFQIESGILFDRQNPQHVKEAEKLYIKPIDLVVCNLYPFEQQPEIETIDVGGPTMVRAAAKNFQNVIVVVDPNDYETVAEILNNRHAGKPKAHPASEGDSGQARMTLEFRKSLAAKAFEHLSFYDSQVAKFLETDLFPKEITIAGRKQQDLRYGENPHQKAVTYFFPNTNSPLKKLQRLWGRELSLLNVTDINAGLASVRIFRTPAAVVIKHNSPCGIALGKNAAEALKHAIEADPESAFGGVMVLNTPIDAETARIISQFKDEKRGNVDILAAPEIDKEVLATLSKLRKSMGIYIFGSIPKTTNPIDIKCIEGGFIMQTAANPEEGFKDWKVVTKNQPTKQQMEQMQIAWKFITRIKSNAVIVVDHNLPMTRGIGTGQTSRIRSTKIALEQAGKYTKGAILASDSFFPFDDAVKLAEKYNIGAIIQQGGSINDKASIDAANKAEIPMVFTGIRAFWH